MVTLPRETDAAGPRTAVPLTLTGRTDANGNLTLKTSSVPLGFQWLISYLTVTTDSALTPQFAWYVDEALSRNLRDGAPDATSAVAAYNPPRLLDQGQVLIGVWTGATPNVDASMTIEYDVKAS